MNTPPSFLLTLAACGSMDFHWPESSLLEIKDYEQRVDEVADSQKPDGDCPITGSLCYSETVSVPACWKPLFDAVEALNKSRVALAAFLSHPREQGVTVRIWTAQRSSWSEDEGFLRDVTVRTEGRDIAAAVVILSDLTAARNPVGT